VTRQIPEPEKRARADFVVDTGGTVENCNSQIDTIITKLQVTRGDAYDRFWRG
jgi:dephospho-CoA kinase